MTAGLRSHARTDVGRVRAHNEDNFLVDRRLGLFVVCDGMGGHASGEVASAVAVHALREAIKRDVDFIDDFLQGVQGDGKVRPEDIKNLLEAAVHAANAAVFSQAQAEPEKRGMGTTLTAMMLLGTHGFIAHVGDSRAYLLRGGEVRMLTEDHSVINELKRRGKLTPELVEKLQVKNAVTRAVGVFETVEVDTWHFLAAPGDRFMLCSDGFHGYLAEEAELGRLMDGLSEEMATQTLIDTANERGGKDNITAIVVAIPEQDDEIARDLSLSYETLAHMPFFRHLTPRELLRVQAMARPKLYADGDLVVREGDAGDSLFVVLRGSVKVRKGEAELTALGAGEFFGEMALVDNAPRSATIVSDGASRLLELARGDFLRFLREEKDIGLKLLWNFLGVLTRRLRDTSAQLGEAREALSAEDLTDVLFIDDDTSIPPAARLPSVPALRAAVLRTEEHEVATAATVLPSPSLAFEAEEQPEEERDTLPPPPGSPEPGSEEG